MADWITARGGNTERTLTAAAGPLLATPIAKPLQASFCVAQRRRTEFLCSEKEGTARGTRGRFFRCVGLTVTHKKRPQKEHTTHTKERTPVVHLTLAYLTHSDRVIEVARGANARPGRSPKTNRDRRRRLRKRRRSSRVAAIVNDASFLFCGRTGFGGFEFSLFKRRMGV